MIIKKNRLLTHKNYNFNTVTKSERNNRYKSMKNFLTKIELPKNQLILKSSLRAFREVGI